MSDQRPDWDDIDGLCHLPVAVLVRLPDGRMVAIYGLAETVTQYVERGEPGEFRWAPDEANPLDAGVRVSWHQGYTMRWEAGPAPMPPQQEIGNVLRELPR